MTIVDETGFGARGVHVRAAADTAEHRWAPDTRDDIHSVSKGVSVIAAGIAADEGLLDLDDPVARHLPDFALGDGVDEVTLRHLLTMTSGIDMPWGAEATLADWPDTAAEFLSRPSRGRVFQYSNASTYTAMRALGAIVGDVAAWLEPRLFAPLRIADVEWDRCPHGWIAGGAGLRLGTEELSRIGRLIRDRGVWAATPLITGARIDAMHSGWVDTGAPAGPYAHYALAGWDGPGAGWRLHGAYGQLLIFVDDVVVTATADDHAGADPFAAAVVDLLQP